MKAILKAIAVAIILPFAASASAATLIVDANGELAGATGVNVGGSLYDVSFADGTCINVFSGCDSATDITFQSLADATVAAQALLDQVFLDSALGSFDTNPGATRGCESSDSCLASVPFFASPGQVAFAVAINTQNVDATDWTAFLPSQDFSSDPRFVWAVFTPQNQSAIPESSTWAMMLLGFGAIGFALRRRGASAHLLLPQ